MYREDGWKGMLPEFLGEDIMNEIEARKKNFEGSDDEYDCISLIWRHQPSTEDSLEKCYIEIQFTERTNYQIVMEDQPPKPGEVNQLCFVNSHMNKHPCVKLIENHRAKELGRQYAFAFLTAYTYSTIDIDPTGLLPHKDKTNFPIGCISRCKHLTIRGSWDYRDENLIGDWLAKLQGRDVNIITGSTCARINRITTLMCAASVNITGFTDIAQDFLHDFDGPKFKLEGSVVQLISGAGIVKMLLKWMTNTGGFKHDVILQGIIEPTFVEKIRDHFRNHGLLEKCIIDDKTKNLKFDHTFGRYRLQIITKSDFIHANLHGLPVETPQKSPTPKSSSSKKSGLKKK